MKSRYRFIALPLPLGSPDRWLLESRPGALTLYMPTSGFHGLTLILFFVIVFCYLGAWIAVVTSPWFQDAEPWRDLTLLVTVGGVLIGGLFASMLWFTVVGQYKLLNRYIRKNPDKRKKVDSWELHRVKDGMIRYNLVCAKVGVGDFRLVVKGRFASIKAAIELAAGTSSRSSTR